MLLFASELAACAGMNRYCSVEETLIKVWQRLYPQAFSKAREQADRMFKTVEEGISETSKGLDFSEPDNIKLVQKQPLDSGAIERVLALPLNERRAAIVEHCTPTLEISPSLQAELNTAIESAASLVDGPALAQACREIIQRPSLQDVVPTVLAEVTAVVNREHGNLNENRALMLYETATLTTVCDTNARFYKCTIAPGLQIGGRVDGLTSDAVIEVKCRRRTFFKIIPKYERVQLLAYMQLTGRRRGELVQYYDEDVRITELVFDSDEFSDIVSRLCEFQAKLVHVMTDAGAAKDLFATAGKKN